VKNLSVVKKSAKRFDAVNLSKAVRWTQSHKTCRSVRTRSLPRSRTIASCGSRLIPYNRCRGFVIFPHILYFELCPPLPLITLIVRARCHPDEGGISSAHFQILKSPHLKILKFLIRPVSYRSAAAETRSLLRSKSSRSGIHQFSNFQIFKLPH